MKFLFSLFVACAAGSALAQSVVSSAVTYKTVSTVISTGSATVTKSTNTDTQTVTQSDGSVVRNVYNLAQTTTTTPTTSRDLKYEVTTVMLSNGKKVVTEKLISDTVVTKNVVTPSTVKTLASSTVVTPASAPKTVVALPAQASTATTTTSAFNATSYYGNSPYMGTPTQVFSSKPSDWVNAQYNNGSNQYINSAAAWARGWTGKGSTIMIMDTGVDVNNVAFAGKIKYQYDRTGTGIQDKVGHGSNVAGIALGARNGVTPTGVAFDANLAVAKLSDSKSLVASDAVNALAWAADKSDIVVANLSANTNYSSAYQASVKKLTNGMYASTDTVYGGANYYNLEDPKKWAQALTSRIAITVSAGNQVLPYVQNPATFAAATDDSGKLLLNGQMLVVGNWNAQGGRVEGAQAGSVCKTVSGGVCQDRYRISDFYILAPGMLVNSAAPVAGSTTGSAALSGSSQAAAAAAGAIAVINQLWPYMTASNQVQLLLKTANKNLPGYTAEVMGQGLLDLDKATQPVGNLGIALNGRTSSAAPLSGGISLSKTSPLTAATLSSISAVDGMQRDFKVDLSGSLASNTLSASPLMLDADPGQSWSARWTGLVALNDATQPFNASNSGSDQTISIDSRLLAPGSKYKHQVTLTTSAYNPYVSFSGAYGQTNLSTTTEYSLMYQPGQRLTKRGQPQGWWAQGGIMLTKVDFVPGMVTEVTPIYAMQGMGGYQYQDWNFFGGFKPTVVAGDVHMTLPTSVDVNGVMQYSQVQNSLSGLDPVAYVGVKFQKHLPDVSYFKQQVGLRLQAAQDGSNSARAYYALNF
ncbi:MAG: hypothetical protein EBR27_00655 [Betaproteobacteria bacterium]|nr:hypothetical protein [Betaproteobacteria bacterium]NBY72120.1 hypothetical protein [Betaproteobacteria bacterium]NDD12327.1 hypothetical protein [Betaproteobacteria bacterium]